MPLTLDQLRKLVEGEKLTYFLDPRPGKSALMLYGRGIHGRFQFVMVLELEGTFLQFRTVDYLNCPPDHHHLKQVLQAMASLNFMARLVKFGWDPRDGEIVAYADVWLMDGTLTQTQFGRMLSNYLPTIDMSYRRLQNILETGQDPGDQQPEEALETMLREAGGEASLPPALRKLLDKIKGKEKPGGEKAPDLSEI